MPERLLRLTQPIRARWELLTRTQKIQLGSAVLVILVALVLTIYFTTRTNYERFISGLNGTDLIAIESVLQSEGIKNRREEGGTAIYVDRKRFADAKVAIESNPSVAGIQFTYEDGLNISGMSTTETQKREIAIRVKQSELKYELESLDGVNRAMVELNIPITRRFLTSEQNNSSASITLDTSREFTQKEGQAIAQVVCHAVEGLLMENIVVIDSHMNTLYDGVRASEDDGLATLLDNREIEKKKISNEIRAAFSQLFDEIQPVLNLVYDERLSILEEIRKYAPYNPDSEQGLPYDDHTKSMKAEGTTPEAEPGQGSNDYESPSYDTGSTGNSSAKSNSRDVNQYLYDEEYTQTKIGPGGYIRDLSSMSIPCYIYKVYNQKLWMQEEVEDEEPRTDDDWEQFKIDTIRTPLDDPDIETYRSIAANATGMNPENITISVFEVPVFYDYTAPTTNIQMIIMYAVLVLLIILLALGLIRRQRQEEEIEEVEPELSVEDLLVSTQLEEAREEEIAEKMEEIDFYKESEVKKQIENFVNEKPEAVAALLRNWLNSDEW